MLDQKNKLKVVFLGTPIIACNALEKLNENPDIQVCACVTQTDKPAGRGHKMASPPVKSLAESLGLKVFQPVSIRKDNELLEILKSYEPDFFITIAFGQILSQEVLNIPKIGTINLHASLLPKYRGANPIARAIANGDEVSGVTTMLTSLGVDEGDIVLVEKINIPKDMTTIDLAVKISQIAPDVLYKSLIGLANKTITPVPQNHSEATFANKFTKEETIIDFNKSAQQIHNIVRALYPKPSANTYYNNTLIKVLKTEVIDEKSLLPVGQIIRKSKDGLYVATGEKVLLIKTLKPEGKKEMNAYDWSCGLKELSRFGIY